MFQATAGEGGKCVDPVLYASFFLLLSMGSAKALMLSSKISPCATPSLERTRSHPPLNLESTSSVIQPGVSPPSVSDSSISCRNFSSSSISRPAAERREIVDDEPLSSTRCQARVQACARQRTRTCLRLMQMQDGKTPSFRTFPTRSRMKNLFIEGVMQFYPRALGSSSEFRGGRGTVKIPTPAKSLCDTPSRLVC